MSRALKVYYCNDCGCRMPLYYKKDQSFRDEHWHFCFRCKSKNIISQVEQWDYHREKAAQRAVTREQLDGLRNSAALWRRENSQEPQRNISSGGGESSSVPW